MTDYDIGLEIPLVVGRPVGERNPNSRMGRIRGLPENGSWFFAGDTVRLVQAAVSTLRQRGHITFRVCLRTRTENGVKGVRAYRLPEDASE